MQMAIQNEQWPKTYLVVAKWLKDNKVKLLECPLQSPDLNPRFVGSTEKACVNKEAYKPDSSVRRNGPEAKPLIVRNLWKTETKTFDPS